MKLLLSSDALPGAAPEEYGQACRARALDGLELLCGRDCGAFAGGSAAAPVRWARLPQGADAATVSAAATLATRLGAGLLTAEPLPSPRLPVPLALVHGTDLMQARQASAWARYHGVGTAWEIAAAHVDVAAVAEVYAVTAGTLAHVRLRGAGPEEAGGEAVGALMVRLALDGYGGTVALAPSPGADPDAWAAWLFGPRARGCGAATRRPDPQRKPSLS